MRASSWATLLVLMAACASSSDEPLMAPPTGGDASGDGAVPDAMTIIMGPLDSGAALPPVDAGAAPDTGIVAPPAPDAAVVTIPEDSPPECTTGGACTTSCGSTGTRTCVGGFFTPCVPPAETCNGVDDDCNSIVDGMTRPCTSACGMGNETCSGGVFGACDAPTAGSETCNRTDDDCNGVVDDGLRVAIERPTHATLTTYDSVCAPEIAASLRCNMAATGYCATTCTGRGGIVVSDNGTDTVTVCMGIDESVVSYADLTALHPQCTRMNASTAFCSAATHRHCRARGYASGIGILGTTPTEATVGCLRDTLGPETEPTARASVVTTTFAALNARNAGCTLASISNVSTLVSCRNAAHRLCRDRSFTSGFGPVEAGGETAIIVCVNP